MATNRCKIERGAIAGWFKNIASFTGEFYKTYHSTELKGVLNYVAACLNRGDNTEIWILKQIILKMSAWNPPKNLTEKMLCALAAGPKLKTLAFKLTEDLKGSEKSAKTLCEALARPLNDQNLTCAIELIVIAAQQAKGLKSSSGNEKLNKSLYDILMNCVISLIDLLSLNYSNPAEYSAKVLPGNAVHFFVSQCELDLSIATGIIRPGIDVSKLNEFMGTLAEVKEDSGVPKDLYSIFWTLCLSDIKSTENEYFSEIKKLKEQVNEGLRAHKLDKEKAKLHETIEELDVEVKFLNNRHSYYLDFINKHYHFVQYEPQTVASIVEHCLVPRIVFSPSDALYCVYFIETLEKLKSTLSFTVELFSATLTAIMSKLKTFTEGESTNLGLFILEFLRNLRSRSPGDQELVEKIAQLNSLLSEKFSGCFDVEDYYLQRNVIHILSRIHKVFPDTKEVANELIQQVESYKDSEYPDLSVLATRYHDKLTMQFTVKETAEEANDKQEENKGLLEIPQKRSRTPEEPKANDKPRERRTERGDRTKRYEREDWHKTSDRNFEDGKKVRDEEKRSYSRRWDAGRKRYS